MSTSCVCELVAAFVVPPVCSPDTTALGVPVVVDGGSMPCVCVAAPPVPPAEPLPRRNVGVVMRSGNVIDVVPPLFCERVTVDPSHNAQPAIGTGVAPNIMI